MGRVLSESEMQIWDGWLCQTQGSNIHQTAVYRTALSLYGHSSEVLVTEESGQITGGALLASRRTAPLFGPWVHTSGGLAIEEGATTPARLESLLTAAINRAEELKAGRLEVSFRIPIQVGDEVNSQSEELREVLRAYGFSPIRSQGTYHINLSTHSEEELLGTFGENQRRQIQRALDEDVVVERTLDSEDFLAFEKARGQPQSSTKYQRGSKMGIDPLPENFATKVFLPLAQAGQGDLFVARFRDIARKYIFVGSVGVPIRHERAVAEAALEPGCPDTEAVLHYTAMCHYRAQGKRFYDLGGAEGPIPDPAHPNYRDWKFKHEFNGTYVRFLGSWKRTLRPSESTLLEFLRHLVTLKRGLAKRLTTFR